MSKLQRVTHKLNIKLFGLYSVCYRFADVSYTFNLIKSSKIKLLPIVKKDIQMIHNCLW